VELRLSWIGQEEILQQLLAAWMVIDEHDIPFNPRLIGKPGVGKTTLAYAAARKPGPGCLPFSGDYGHPSEDLIITPVIARTTRSSMPRHHWVTAMLRGGALIIDEGTG